MLINKSTGKTLMQKTRIADSVWLKAKGLMFESEKNFDYALVFVLGSETRLGASIHMMFMAFPIDVVYLNEKKEVVDIARGLKPWRLNYTPKRKAKYFIELPAGKSTGVKLGHKIEWK